MKHMHVINQVIEKSARYNKPLYSASLDYEKAFDSAQIAAVLKAFEDQGVEKAYITLLEDIYRESTGTIILPRQSEIFPIRNGAREGDTISLKLFTACLESVFGMLDSLKLGVRVNGECSGHLRFADDIVLLSNSVEDLHRMIHELHRESLVVGLKINVRKSEVMSNSLAAKQPLIIGNAILEKVEECSYLGQLVSADPTTRKKYEEELAWDGKLFGSTPK